MPVAFYAVGGFLLILVLFVLLRTVSHNRFEVRHVDIFLALIPVVLVLILGGHIKELAVGDLKIVPAVQNATKSSVRAQVSPLPIEAISSNPKDSVSKIPKLVRGQTQALSLQLGFKGYQGLAIKNYLETLTRYAFFEYVVLIDSDGHFFGLFNADQLFELLQNSTRQPIMEDFPNFDRFTEWITLSKIAQIEALPGFVGKVRAVKKTTHKYDVLQRMEELDVQTLPVIDEEDRLVGILERSKLSASILIDISERLEGMK